MTIKTLLRQITPMLVVLVISQPLTGQIIDTDRDTISDDEELILGWDPTIPNYQLSNSCFMGDGRISCWGVNAATTATPLGSEWGLDLEFTEPWLLRSGGGQNCVMDRIKGLVCWGRFVSSETPNIMDAQEIVLVNNGGCLIDGGRLRCWGVLEHDNVPVLENTTSLATSGENACAVENGLIYCWNIWGDLFEEGAFTAIENVVSIFYSGFGTYCAFLQNDVFCFDLGGGAIDLVEWTPDLIKVSVAGTGGGENTICVLRGTSLACSREGQVLFELDDVAQFEAEGNKICALTYNQGIVCNTSDWLGQTDSPPSWGQPPQLVTPILGALDSVELGPATSLCVADKLRGLSCMLWQHRMSSFYDRYAVVPEGLRYDEVKELVNYRGTACIITYSNDVKCWSASKRISVTDWEKTLLEIPVVSKPEKLTMGFGSACLIDGDQLVCWGTESYLQSVPQLNSVTGISIGDTFSCAIAEGEVVCWGPNNDGQLNVPEFSPITSVTVGFRHACAIGDGGDLVCWGDGAIAPGISGISRIKARDRLTCAESQEGVNCWSASWQPQVNFFAGKSIDEIVLTPYGPCILSQNMKCDDKVIYPMITIDPDADGHSNFYNLDEFPLDPLEHKDSDADGLGDNGDVFPNNPEEQFDNDLDGVGDNADLFDDDPYETSDNDLDGIGDNADLDDDNDGFTDEQEAIDGTDPLNPFSCQQGCFSFDIDLDEKLEADALTDGLLVIRHLFGFSGDALVASATSNDATRQEAEEITNYLDDAESELDIDGDGEAGALTDGLLLIRYLFGFSGDSLISGAVSENAERTTAEQIETYISERIPIL